MCYVQKQIFITATNWISVVYLVDLHGFIQSHHHIVSYNAQWEEGAIEAAYVLDALSLTGRNYP